MGKLGCSYNFLKADGVIVQHFKTKARKINLMGLITIKSMQFLNKISLKFLPRINLLNKASYILTATWSNDDLKVSMFQRVYKTMIFLAISVNLFYVNHIFLIEY